MDINYFDTGRPRIMEVTDTPEYIELWDKMQTAADHFKGLLEVLYDNKYPLDLIRLEDHLEEIDSALGTRFNFRCPSPMISRVKNKLVILEE